MRKNLHAAITIIVSLVFLISCQPNVVATPDTKNGDIQDIRVQVVEPTRTTARVEQFPLPNCGGTDKLVQSLGTYASVSKSATVGTSTTVTGGGEVAIPETARLKLEIQVELAYEKAFESANSRTDSIEMSAAAGTHVIYTVLWEEQTFNSIIQYSADGKVYEAPYTYQLSVPKIDTSYNVDCGGNNGNTQPMPTIVLPTPVPPSLPTYPETLCPTSISQSVINSWKIGVADVPTVHTYINDFDRDRRGGEFSKGTSIPAGVIIATNFDETNGSTWSQYPVVAIVHSGSWGLFQSTGEYIAPNAGACRVLIP